MCEYLQQYEIYCRPTIWFVLCTTINVFLFVFLYIMFVNFVQEKSLNRILIILNTFNISLFFGKFNNFWSNNFLTINMTFIAVTHNKCHFKLYICIQEVLEHAQHYDIYFRLTNWYINMNLLLCPTINVILYKMGYPRKTQMGFTI